MAAEAGIPVQECLIRLRAAGLKVVGGQRLEGQALAQARASLGLDVRPSPTRPARIREAATALDKDRIIVRLLRPLREKGKVGREHTTPVENVYGHGIPDHLKAEAKRMMEELLAAGCLAEKVSQGRHHVWLTTEGLARLGIAEAESEEAAA